MIDQIYAYIPIKDYMYKKNYRRSNKDLDSLLDGVTFSWPLFEF